MQDITIEINISKTDSQQLCTIITNGYLHFCDNNHLKHTLSEEKNSSRIKIHGLNAKDIFKQEIGIHNSMHERNKMCHVYVYDSYTCEDHVISEQDIEITATHSSGAGGQHINTTDSAIKVTHLKTGISATCQSERSQFQNKEKALENLKIKVEKHYQTI